MENTFPTLEAVWTPPALHSGLLFTAAATGVQSTLWRELFLDSEPASQVDGWLRDCEAVLIMNKISPFLDQTFKNVAKSQDTSFDLTGSCAEGLFCFVLFCFFFPQEEVLEVFWKSGCPFTFPKQKTLHYLVLSFRVSEVLSQNASLLVFLVKCLAF